MAVISAALPAPVAAVEVAPGVEWSTVVREPGPVRINVLEVDAGRVKGVLSQTKIAGRQRVSTMSRRVRAVAAVNGGYFAQSGDPVGVLVQDGELLSEAVNGRSALVLAPNVPPVIAPLRYSGRITVNGRTRDIDGIDRTRGLIPSCGGRGGDLPTNRPNSLLTCADASELVLLSRAYGAFPPREGGVEAVLRDGTVAHVRPPGTGPVPPVAHLLTGTGDGARFLRDVALPGSRVQIALRLTGAGRPLDVIPAERRLDGTRPVLPPSAPSLVVGGGPRILRDGRVAAAARAEGFAPLRSFAQVFVNGRQPRTLAGVTEEGRLLLVTIDGRRPGWSVGMTLPEAARLMRSLGAVDALNLDGGGSTTMVVRGEVVNRPSDGRGERRVSDALYVTP
jgi:Phosphodiester glycosidase